MKDLISSYKIIDNILDNNLLNIINKIILDNKFAWYFSKYTALSENEDIKKYKNSYEHFQFSHWIILNSEINSDMGSVLQELIKPLPFKLDQILRAKINFLPQYKIEDNRNKHNVPHTDLERKHKVAIIYLDDSDGFTYLFNNDATILKKVEPKLGRVLIFNGDIEHTSSHPIDSKYRIVFNINYLE